MCGDLGAHDGQKTMTNSIYKITDLYPFLTVNIDGRTAHVNDDVTFYTGNNAYPFHNVTFPKGFKTDWASVPRIVWAVYPPEGRYSAAAVLHDRLYTMGEIERDRCDEAFYIAMRESGVSWITANIFYQAVHLFAEPYFNSKSEAGNLTEIREDVCQRG
jgi:hypothetical protein